MTKKLTRIAGFIALAMLLSIALAPQAEAGIGAVHRDTGNYEPIDEAESVPHGWFTSIISFLASQF